MSCRKKIEMVKYNKKEVDEVAKINSVTFIIYI